MTLTTTLGSQAAGPDYAAIKAKQQAVWGAGDYSRIGVTLQIVGEQLCEAMDLRAGQSVLDVAGGNGNASLAAARRFCKVVSTDYVEALLAKSAKRAEAEGLAIDYRTADAESLPFADASFDNVVSTYGVMFTPNQGQAAAELLRVCRPGGKIGLANWTPASFIGQLFKTIGRYVAPPTGVNSPAAWGTREFLETHFGPHVQKIEAQPRYFTFRYQSPTHWLDVFSTYYGPTLKAFESLDSEARQALRSEVLALIEAHNRATDGTMVVPSEYLEVVITR
ncbi:class I SAM-dependent methyltransferase [Halomonas sp. MCCC 1A11062]|uniref:class I SAM-dependent methyltransferase n=1 Tax=Halomonas sp. MCCC 1A11062 TaxID=2733485 RepID=UPI001F3F9D47|nr:class I SAM-dependent methyltransferase [Halomonas sp. MCCC 1A11062]MCE8040390.1 methyltransferase domain-containing protein [Halomonas sp. MCCC 1A11062]